MDRPTEPVNPYAPARAELNKDPPEASRLSFADRTSVWLGIAGVTATVTSLALGAMVRRGLGQSRKPMLIASGILVEAALLAHAVGIGVVSAAPRGSRTRGLVVNGLALTPNDLLKRYFDHLDLPGQLEWTAIPETEVDSIYEAWQALDVSGP
jgi:hypothetical protein